MTSSSNTEKVKKFKAYADQCVEGGYVMTPAIEESIASIIDHINRFEGVLLIGNPGGGKTFIMECIRRLIAPEDKRSFIQKSAIEIVTQFNIEGHESIIQYDRKHLFIDDLGAELKGKHYTETIEVMEILIQMRYEQFQKHKCITHFTSNFKPSHLYSRYGLRVESRLKGLAQIIIIGEGENTVDYRPLRNFKGFPVVNHPKAKTKDDLDWERNYQTYCKNASEHAKQKRESEPKTLGAILKQSIGTDHLKKP